MSGKTDKIKIITVGGGWVANTRHIPALKQSGLFDVVGVVSNDSERAVNTAKRHDLPNHATALDFAPQWQKDAAAVMIGTTPHTHHELARAALLAGKHVITEKPMTIDPAHAAELAAIATEKKLTLAVVHNFQFSRASNLLRRDISCGRLGAVRSVYGVQLCNHARKIHDWCDQMPFGLFFDEAPHFYYMLRWLGGGDLTLLDASAWKNRHGMNTPMCVSAHYRSATDVPVHIHINFDSSITEWHVTVVGERGVAVVDVWRDIYVFVPNDGVHTAIDIARTAVFASAQHLWGIFTGGLRHISGRHLYGNDEVVRRFYRAIRGEDSLAGMNPAEGRRVVEMMHELISNAKKY